MEKMEGGNKISGRTDTTWRDWWRRKVNVN